MKKTMLLLLILIIGFFFSCNPTFKKGPKIVELDPASLLRNVDPHKEVVVGVFLFNDSLCDIVRFKNVYGASIDIFNDGTQNCYVCRYDTTLRPIWMALINGKGNREKATQAVVDTANNAVYVMGCFEDTAFFTVNDRSNHNFVIKSHGGVDMFVAKYDYRTGLLLWATSGGTAHDDVIFQLNGQTMEASKLTLDSGTVHAMACFNGRCYFGDTVVESDSLAIFRVGYSASDGLFKEVQRIKN